MKNDYYVYIYLNPKKPGKFCYKNICFLFEPFYIGKGTRNRCYKHIWKCSKNVGNNIRKKQTINSLLQLYSLEYLKQYIIKVAINLTHTDALLLESDFILEIGQICNNTGPLTNILTRGGRSTSADLHKIRSERAKRMWTLERKIEHSEKMKLFIHSEAGINSKLALQKVRGKNNGKQISLTRKNKFKTGEIKRPVGSLNSNSKLCELESPAGQKFLIKGELEKFCIEQNLGYWSIAELAKGRNKKGNYKGWKAKYVNQSPNKSNKSV
jgi:hypothetical protein